MNLEDQLIFHKNNLNNSNTNIYNSYANIPAV